MTGTENISVSRGVRLTVGLLSLTAGLFWLLMNLSGVYPRDVFVGVALAGGGLVLLLWRRLPLSGRLVSAAAGVIGLGGTAAGLTARSAEICCMFAYREGRGWPYEWLGRGAVAETPGEAQRLAAAQGWEWSASALFVDVTVWAYAGLMVIVVGGLARRAARRRAETTGPAV
ncbi:hypothetical protein QLQ12_14020 [Actinoplanes sp. NEAU-A12]|uniref:Disulfide bond formation protein B n=1 Tax=Actinoplanes sandaracinus TaxID=3045177 RepID=A0ABT6WJ06_9ACTN|nr:hypothetical protein [Actinoplanes sandaracinus]MDI6099716.1 hypothetical protein [Actinoplanes sandaracinus]